MSTIKFQLDKLETKKALAWIDAHSKDHVMPYEGAIGGRWTYLYTPTSLGIFKSITCCCGAKENLTDYDQI